MAAFSDYLENALLDHILRNTALTSPTTVYLALFDATGTALETNSLTGEISGGSYARQAVAFDAPAAGATANTSAVSFTNMPAVTVAYVAVTDAATAGNVLFHGALTTSRTLNAGDTFTIAAGDLDITVD